LRHTLASHTAYCLSHRAQPERFCSLSLAKAMTPFNGTFPRCDFPIVTFLLEEEGSVRGERREGRR